MTESFENVDHPEAPASDLPSALDRLDEIRALLDSGRPVIFLDYDGTLSPIVSDPDQALLDDRIRAVLEALAARVPVVILSGRDLDDVRGKVGIDGIHYAGSHGFDLAGPPGSRLIACGLPDFEQVVPSLRQAATRLRDILAPIPGFRLEEKRFAVTVHYREVPGDRVDEVAAKVRGVASGFPDLRVTGGKKILELRPVLDWDKGRALVWLLDRLQDDAPGSDGAVPVYLGDDVTDEDAFRAIRDRGIGIVVGPEDRPTAAAYALEDTGQVRTFLEAITPGPEAV